MRQRPHTNESRVLNEEQLVTDVSLVAIVDDDVSMRQSLPDLVGQFGYRARTFASAEAFLASDCVGQTNACSSTLPCLACPALSCKAN